MKRVPENENDGPVLDVNAKRLDLMAGDQEGKTNRRLPIANCRFKDILKHSLIGTRKLAIGNTEQLC